MPRKQRPKITATLTDAALAVLLGLRIVRAGDLDSETAPYRWGAHARSRITSNVYPLQPEKLNAHRASFAAQGILPRTLAAYVAADGLIDVAEGRHWVHVLPPDTPVTVDVKSGSRLDALRTASYSNGEGFGYSLAASLEQTSAIVLHLAERFDVGDRCGIPLPGASAQRAYVADAASNPFTSRSRPGDSWPDDSYTADSIAQLAGISLSSTQRCLSILSGLWQVGQDPSAVAGMTTAQALAYADVCRSTKSQLGEDVVTAAHRSSLAVVRDAIKTEQRVLRADKTTADTPAKIAAEVRTGRVVTAPPAPRLATNKTRRSTPQRVHDLIKEAVDIIAKDESKELPEPAYAAQALVLVDKVRKYFKTTARSAAAKTMVVPAAVPIIEEETINEPALPPELAARLDEMRASQ